MKKKIIMSMGAAVAVLLSGCGGSSSTDSGTGTAVNTGTAYYLDSAVSGINYKCGNQEGITGANGEFTFEAGASCTFYLGDLKLRDMDKALLQDGAKIVEDDIDVAMLLQSLDIDGNPDNGITITSEVVAAVTATLNEDGEAQLPNTPAEIEALVAVLQNTVTDYAGHAVTEAQAQAHLETTQTKALLAGKTFYAYWNDSDDGEQDIGVAKVIVNEEVTSWTYQDILGGNNSGTEGLEVEGKQLVINHPEEDELERYEVSSTDKYVMLKNINDDFVLYFYYTQADAEAAYNTVTTILENGFTTEWLNGKTLYFVQYDDFGYDGANEPGMRWNMARMDFTSSTVSWTEYDVPDTSTHTFNYSVTSDGKIKIDEGHFSEITLQSLTDDYLKVCEDGDCNTYLFFDQAKARTFRDQQNQTATTDLAALIVGKTLYQNCNGNIESITFGTDGIISWIEDGHTETESYRIDGNTVYTDDGDREEAHPLLESTETYVKFDDGDGETSTFYFTAADAQNAPADDCGDGDGGNIEVSNITSGQVVFKDDNNNTIAVPSDAWIRITPSQYQEEGNWNGLRCHINSDGTFGDLCYISENEDGIREAFANSNTPYQIVIFKNHIEPDETHWNCGEDVYKYLGNDLSSDSWTNIKVFPDDYQDRSNETCND